MLPGLPVTQFPHLQKGVAALPQCCSRSGSSVWQPHGKGTSQALSWEPRCPSARGARSLCPLVPAPLALPPHVDPPPTAAFPGALAVCAQRDIPLLCSLPAALQTSLFLPLSRCLICKSLRAPRASARPRLCSVQCHAAPALPPIAHQPLGALSW